jgi:hypothetical protein
MCSEEHFRSFLVLSSVKMKVLRVRRYLGDVEGNVRRNLQNKRDVRILIGLNWLGVGPVAGCFGNGSEPLWPV